MLIEKKVIEYIAQTASSSPAPGGGSASALAGALGTALAEMVINLTVGKKKYAEVSAELSEMLPKLSALRIELQNAVDRDTEAFNQVMAAFGLPKETEEQQSKRTIAIQEATVKATKVPLEVMSKAAQALELTLIVAMKGNKNSASDAGVAGLLLGSASDGAALNVMINLAGLPDTHPFKSEASQELVDLSQRKQKLTQDILNAVSANMQ
jgi:formiminotetrahydrofolate cyclodeaminase